MLKLLETRFRQIAEIPSGYRLFALSDDFANIALVTHVAGGGGKKTLTVNGVEIAFEHGVSGGRFTRSGSLAFIEQKGRMRRHRMGNEADPWFAHVSVPSFSQDGSHYVYKGCEVAGKTYSKNRVENYGRWTLMVDGERRWPEFNVVSSAVTNGGQVAFSAQLEPEGAVLVRDGEIVAESRSAQAEFIDLSFSRDGAHLGYVEKLDAHRIRAACGDYRSEVGSAPVLALGFSPTNEFYHQLTNGDRSAHWLIVGNRRLPTTGRVTHAFFREDGELVAYVELGEFPKHRVTYPGKAPLPLPYVECAAAHPATGKFAMVCTHPFPGRLSLPNSPSAVWYNGKLTERYDAVLPQHFRFTEDGASLRFVAAHGNLLVLHEVDTSKEMS